MILLCIYWEHLPLTLYWSIRGLKGMFQRHNAILVSTYLVIFFPIAYIHLLILGIFGDSKRERLYNDAAKKAKFGAEVEKKKN